MSEEKEKSEREKSPKTGPPAVLIQLSPDMSEDEMDQAAEYAYQHLLKQISQQREGNHRPEKENGLPGGPASARQPV